MRICRSGLRLCADSAPVFQSAEHNLDPVAPFVAPFVVADGFATRLPPGDARAYPLVFQCFPEPVSVIATVRDHPFGSRQAAQQGGSSGVVAHLACGHEELQRTPLRIGDGMQLGVQPAFRAPDEAPALVIGPPFFARRLEAVRCAFR